MELNMETVVARVNAAGVHAFVEHTGGGMATIFAGRSYLIEDEARFQCLAGPGWFEGPDFTEARGDTTDFFVGVDDVDSNDYKVPADEDDAVRLIIEYCQK
jgi:hypothetical protein